MFRSNSRRFKKHVDSFKNHPNLSPSTREVSKGTRKCTVRQRCIRDLISDSYTRRIIPGVYDTVFACNGGKVFVLRVDCRAEPMVQLFGCRAEHPLIDSDMHVRIAFHDSKLLGAALMDTIVQMQLNPPRILGFTDESVRAIQREDTARSTPATEDQGPTVTVTAQLVEDMRNLSFRCQTAVDNLTSSTASSTHDRPVHEIRRSEGPDGQSFALTFKDQAQTVLECGANTPSVLSELPLVEAQIVYPEETRFSRERLSESNTSQYTFGTPSS